MGSSQAAAAIGGGGSGGSDRWEPDARRAISAGRRTDSSRHRTPSQAPHPPQPARAGGQAGTTSPWLTGSYS